jgi:entericidin B
MLNRIFGVVMAAAVLVLYGCNTVEGMGKDVERGGEKIQSGAEKTKAKM